MRGLADSFRQQFTHGAPSLPVSIFSPQAEIHPPADDQANAQREREDGQREEERRSRQLEDAEQAEDHASYDAQDSGDGVLSHRVPANQTQYLVCCDDLLSALS